MIIKMITKTMPDYNNNKNNNNNSNEVMTIILNRKKTASNPFHLHSN